MDNSFTKENNNEFNTNCLALTIRQDYRLTVVSNTASSIKRVLFKIFMNYGLLNFLSMIL